VAKKTIPIITIHVHRLEMKIAGILSSTHTREFSYTGQNVVQHQDCLRNQ